MPGKDLEKSPEWEDAFQYAIVHLQKSMERAYALKAKAIGASLLVCDRGVLDGAAYTGGVEAFCRRYNVDYDKAVARYKSVIHLESLAAGKPELYSKTNNAERMESLPEAQALEYAIRAAWKRHPDYHFIKCKDNISNKIEIAIQLVRRISS